MRTEDQMSLMGFELQNCFLFYFETLRFAVFIDSDGHRLQEMYHIEN